MKKYSEFLSEASERSHKTYPLPDSSNDGAAAYDHATGSLRVYKHPKGHYVADMNNKYDVHKNTAEEMREHLKKIGGRHVGWERYED